MRDITAAVPAGVKGRGRFWQPVRVSCHVGRRFVVKEVEPKVDHRGMGRQRPAPRGKPGSVAQGRFAKNLEIERIVGYDHPQETPS
jgi:hypothetical protein